MGQGTSPLWGLGQRPKVLKPSISAIFKVHLSLFFRLSFFIDYLTLPVKQAAKPIDDTSYDERNKPSVKQYGKGQAQGAGAQQD